MCPKCDLSWTEHAVAKEYNGSSYEEIVVCPREAEACSIVNPYCRTCS